VSGHRSSILIVDDDDMLLRACKRLLRSSADVTTVTSAAAARAMVAHRPTDALIIDFRLGHESGLDLLREFKEQRPHAKVLLWSAFLHHEVIVAAMRAGADDVRSKPVDPQALLRWVATSRWPGMECRQTASLELVEWEHAHRVITECDGNLTEAARRLGVGRATLRRILDKPMPPR
jgi:two-component system, response regulator RegA